MPGKILVTCATGSLGQMTIKALISQKFPTAQIVALARDVNKPIAKSFEEQGMQVREGDFFDYNSLGSSLEGINTLMFISSGTFDKRTDQHKNVVNAARECSIRHIVYTSLLKCSKESKYIAMPQHLATEEFLKASTIPYTIFRNGFYADLVPFMIGDALQTGKFMYPGGNCRVNLVAKQDVAEALARVLQDPKAHTNKTYEITSWKNYSFADLAAIITRAVGRKIVYQDMTVEAYERLLKARGVSEKDIPYMSSTSQSIVEDIEPDLQELLGRRPKSMEEFLPGLFAKK